MPNYKEMYLKMFRANEQAISTLISAQRICEELFISQPKLQISILPQAEKGTEQE